jgi:biopolymer transport protein ExbD
MSMNLASSNNTLPEPMSDLNMTPLIDVMLVLIIMLIITIPMQMHATTLTMPTPDTKVNDSPVVRIDVDFDGSVTWDGAPVINRAALESKLAGVARAAVPPVVQLRANKLAKYKTVAGVMATAQRAGVMNIGIIGNEQFI